jgi:hypothetical protein
MRDPVPDCLVTGYEPLVDALDLPDPSDRHVLAAAIRCNAQAIVTFNTRHFPEGVLSRFDIEAQHPDTFVADLVELNPATVVHVLHENIGRLANPPISLGDRLARLGSTGLPRTADLLEEELGFGG